jgi:hypothetical protein
MHANQVTLEMFYNAFERLDADTMASCYSADAHFDDEVFSLRGQEQVAGMWRMLCETTKARAHGDWVLVYRGIEANATTGKAHWEADYRFSATGRLVHNVIDGVFEFNGQGLIARHHDRFNFWSWSRQALGMPGLMLGWTPVLQQKVRRTAAANLQKFMASRKA